MQLQLCQTNFPLALLQKHTVYLKHIWVGHYLCFFLCSKLEKQKEKKRKEEQKRKIASLSFNPEDEEEDEEENEDEEDCEYWCEEYYSFNCILDIQFCRSILV